MVKKIKAGQVDFTRMSLQQLDEWYEANLKKYENAEGQLDFGDEVNSEFYSKTDLFERYTDARNKIMSRAPVQTKDIVADEDAVNATLKTYHAINTKIQEQISKGVELNTNDIKLLVEMMKALNGD